MDLAAEGPAAVENKSDVVVDPAVMTESGLVWRGQVPGWERVRAVRRAGIRGEMLEVRLKVAPVAEASQIVGRQAFARRRSAKKNLAQNPYIYHTRAHVWSWFQLVLDSVEHFNLR